MARITDEKGIMFTLDVGIAFLVVMLAISIMFVAIIQLAESRASQTTLFEHERSILFVDSLLKRGVDENGLAAVSAEQKRVLENRLEDVNNNIRALENILAANNVAEISIDGLKLFEIKHGKCEKMLGITRGATINKRFVVVEVRFCYE